MGQLVPSEQFHASVLFFNMSVLFLNMSVLFFNMSVLFFNVIVLFSNVIVLFSNMSVLFECICCWCLLQMLRQLMPNVLMLFGQNSNSVAQTISQSLLLIRDYTVTFVR